MPVPSDHAIESSKIVTSTEPHDSMEIIPLGAGQEVGRSCILMRFRGRTVMLDCGIHPAHTGAAALPLFDRISIDEMSKIDLMLITHFHLDHTGAVPYVITKTGFKGRTFMTHATRPIARLLLLDYARMSRISVLNDIYNREDIDICMESIETCTFSEKKKIDTARGPIYFTAYKAGHVLGAAMFLVEIDGIRLLYTGDFSCEEDLHLPKAEAVPGRVHALIVESTYGPQMHEPRKERETRFLTYVHDIVRNGGKCLLPVFALGRAQEILILLNDYFDQHDDLRGKVKIFYTTPMANRCIKVFETYASLCSERIQNDANDCINTWKNLKNVVNIPDTACEEWTTTVIEPRVPCAVLAAPGMLQSGVSRDLFELWAPDPRNGVVLTGYTVAGTIAHELSSDPQQLVIDNRVVQVKCQTRMVSFSAHSDYSQTRQFITDLNVDNIILVHGEQHLMRRLKVRLLEEFPSKNVVDPANTQSVVLKFPSADCYATAVGSLTDFDESNEKSIFIVEESGNVHGEKILLDGQTLKEDLPRFTSVRPTEIQVSVKVKVSVNFRLKDFVNRGVKALFEFNDALIWSSSQHGEVNQTVDLGGKVTLIHISAPSPVVLINWFAGPMEDLLADTIAVLFADEGYGDQNTDALIGNSVPKWCCPQNSHDSFSGEYCPAAEKSDRMEPDSEHRLNMNIEKKRKVIHGIASEMLGCPVKETGRILSAEIAHNAGPKTINIDLDTLRVSADLLDPEDPLLSHLERRIERAMLSLEKVKM